MLSNMPHGFRRPIPQFSYLSIYDDWANAICRLAEIDESHTCLDIAAGKGTCTVAVARSAKSVIGIDADPAMVERARLAASQACLKNVSIIRTDAHHLPLGDSIFDVVTSSAGLSNMRNPSLVLKEANRVLNSNGIICIAEPVHDSKATELWEVLSTFKYGYRRFYPTYHEIMRLLRSAGFTPILCEPTLWKRPLNEFLKDAADANAEVCRLLQVSIEGLDAEISGAIGIEYPSQLPATISYECIICLAKKN
jgi:ubiquinone/menaquinone biosynthesis C-methylase UbiE